jgi:signal transduction histidine kinase
MRLRSHLLVLTIGTLLPMIVFAIAGAYWLTERERSTFERGATERVRAVLTAVDQELKSSISTLEALASRSEFLSGDLREIHADLARALGSQADWADLSLADIAGRQLISARHRYGASLPAIRERTSFERVLRTAAPAVGDLIPGLPPQEQQFTVRAPVIVDGVVRYVISAWVKPESINALLMAQRLPADWVGVVLDGNYHFVARTANPDQNLGHPASDSLRAALSGSEEGWFRGVTVEGSDVYTPFSRSAYSRWSVALGIPARVVDEARRDTIISLLASTALAGLIAVALAIWLGRRFSAPIVELASAAKKIGEAGAWPEIPVSSRVYEVVELSRALQKSVERLHRADNAQREAISQLRVSDRAKDEFLAMLGHELRNPLAAIAGASSILSSPRVPDDMAERARSILRRQINNLSRLVDDMLDVSRTLAGKITLVKRPVELSNIVTVALSAFRSSGRLQRHDVSVDFSNAWIDGDEVRMEQVVSNLIGNAIKFTPPGGSIAIKVEASEGDAMLTISDSGRGIPADLIDKVFDPFVQGGQTADRAQGGLGLGLALVKTIVELHGGTVSARSEGGGLGSKFTVQVPRIREAAGVETAGQPRAGERIPSRRILIIEDNQDGREMLRALLTIAGHEVHASADGPSGVAAAAQVAPDLVLIDIALPGMEGYEVARRIRASNGGKSMRLVAISGFGQAEDRRRSLEAGFDAHLTKPFSIETLGEFLSN